MVLLSSLGRSHALTPNEKVEARYEGPKAKFAGKWFGGWVAAAHGDGTCDIHYADGDRERRVPRDRVRVLVSLGLADKASQRAAREADKVRLGMRVRANPP